MLSHTSKIAMDYSEASGFNKTLLVNYKESGFENGMIVDYSGPRAAELDVFYREFNQVTGYEEYSNLSSFDRMQNINSSDYRNRVGELPEDLGSIVRNSEVHAAASLFGQLFYKKVGPKVKSTPTNSYSDVFIDKSMKYIDKMVKNQAKTYINGKSNSIPDTFRLPSEIKTGQDIILY